jgi:HEAT repeat protein
LERWEIIQASVESILTSLGDADPRVRTFKQSVEGNALPRLAESVLADKSLDIDITSRALWLAPLIATPTLTAQIVATLHLSPDLAGLAAAALDRIQAPATLSELQLILVDRSLPTQCRAAAADAMAWLFDPNVKATLLQILNSPNEDKTVVLAVLGALGMSQLHERSTDAASDMCRLLSSEVPDVRDAVLTTLGNIGASETIPRVKALISDGAKTSSGRNVGENAARVLRLLEDQQERRIG